MPFLLSIGGEALYDVTGPQNTNARDDDDYCEDNYEDDQQGCDADSLCEWDDGDCESRDDSSSSDSSSSDLSSSDTSSSDTSSSDSSSSDTSQHSEGTGHNPNHNPANEESDSVDPNSVSLQNTDSESFDLSDTLLILILISLIIIIGLLGFNFLKDSSD